MMDNPPNRSMEHYLRRGNVHFLALKTDGNNEVWNEDFFYALFSKTFSVNRYEENFMRRFPVDISSEYV